MGEVIIPRKALRSPETPRETSKGEFWDFGGIDLGDRIVLVERFLHLPQVNSAVSAYTGGTLPFPNQDFEIVGTNASSDDVTFASGGGVTLETDAASTSSVIVTPHLDTGQTAWAGTEWDTSDSVRFETAVKTGPTVSATTIWAGLKLTNTPVVATDNDQAFFRYQNGVNGGRWQAVYSIGGTDVSADTGVDVEDATAYRLSIEIDASRIARFYINGDLVKESSALTASIDLIPYVGVQTPTGSALARSITLRHEAISKNYQ